MRAKLPWTAESDDTLCRLRAEGVSWERIAAAFGISRWSVIRRGQLVGAHAPLRPPPPPVDPTREALPAGHALSWGAITEGTLLEGVAYPWPPLGCDA